MAYDCDVVRASDRRSQDAAKAFMRLMNTISRISPPQASAVLCESGNEWETGRGGPRNFSSPSKISRKTTCVFLRLRATSCERGRSSPSRITHNRLFPWESDGCRGKATQNATQRELRREPQEAARLWR
jgi:hypothetical protein